VQLPSAQVAEHRLPAYNNLGEVFVRQGSIADAIAPFENAIRLERGRFEEASTQLREAFKQSDEKDALALYLLSRVYTDMGKQQEAREAERKSLELAIRQNDSALIQTIRAAHR
jgi:tetratricopeptide (TPR) repeat protein